MYAVFEDGSRQYKVSEGERVQVDYRDAELGAQIEFPRVLLYCNGDDCQIGRPLLDGMRVVGEVVDHPSQKYVIQHFRRRKNYRRKKGHRQHYLLVQVQNILLPGQQPPPRPEATTPKEEPASST